MRNIFVYTPIIFLFSYFSFCFLFIDRIKFFNEYWILTFIITFILISLYNYLLSIDSSEKTKIDFFENPPSDTNNENEHEVINRGET